jgi:hypothetical protein
MQIAILNGIYGKPTADLARSYPINLQPVIEDSGISKGYLRTSFGVRTMAMTDADRGGYDWKGVHYRVLGTKLATIATTGVPTIVGDVGTGGLVQFAQSFDRLAIASGGRLYYLKDGALTQVTDVDLGQALSVIWFDGYFMTTDGTSLVVTELSNPTSIDPLKYGSSEADPDPVVGLLALRGEIYALNRYTVEAFINTGSVGFPFARQRGAQIPKGCVGRDAYTLFVETFAFCGSGRNEAPAVYLGGSGQGIRISPRELDDALALLTAAELAAVQLEAINGAGLVELRVHLPDETWCYDWTASQQLDFPVWHRMAGGKTATGAYPARNLTYSGGQWWVGSATAIGVVDPSIPTVFGATVGYQFDTPITYNAGSGAIIHELELVTLAGRTSTIAPTVNLAQTDDGVTFSQERQCAGGNPGDRAARLTWRRLGRMRNWRGFRFRGLATATIGFARLEAQMEGLGGVG